MKRRPEKVFKRSLEMFHNLEQRAYRLQLKRDRLIPRLERFSRRGIVYLHVLFASEPECSKGW